MNAHKWADEIIRDPPTVGIEVAPMQNVEVSPRDWAAERYLAENAPCRRQSLAGS